jgi:hypothetical protein
MFSYTLLRPNWLRITNDSKDINAYIFSVIVLGLYLDYSVTAYRTTRLKIPGGLNLQLPSSLPGQNKFDRKLPHLDMIY